MEPFIFVYLAVGLVIGACLFGWAAVSAIRRHGVRNAVRAAARESSADPPMLGTFAWLCVIAYPLLFVWAVVTEGMDLVGAAMRVFLWVGALGLLRRLRRRPRP